MTDTAAGAVRMGPAGLELVKTFESCMKAIPERPGYFKPYLDPVGVPTLGYGHTNHHLPKFDALSVWSQADCDAALVGDMDIFERHVTANAKLKLEQYEFDALVSWAFNTGGSGSATLWKKLNAGNKAAIPAELAKWNKGGGKVMAGLVRRRKAEGLMFSGKVSDALAVAHNKFVGS